MSCLFWLDFCVLTLNRILMPRRGKKKKKGKGKGDHGGGGGHGESCRMGQIAKRDCHGDPGGGGGSKDSENATKVPGHGPPAESQGHLTSKPGTGSEENATNGHGTSEPSTGSEENATNQVSEHGLQGHVTSGPSTGSEENATNQSEHGVQGHVTSAEPSTGFEENATNKVPEHGSEPSSSTENGNNQAPAKSPSLYDHLSTLVHNEHLRKAFKDPNNREAVKGVMGNFFSGSTHQ